MNANHGTMYDVKVARLALVLDRKDLARKVLEEAGAKRIAVQIEPDGRQSMELKRTKSFNYSRLNLLGLVKLATLGGWVDIDLWAYKTRDGRDIRKAVDFMFPYVKNPPAKWNYQQIVPIKTSELAPVFRAAAIAFGDQRYEEVVAGFPGAERSTLQLLQPADEQNRK